MTTALVYLAGAVEGLSDDVVLRRVIRHAGAQVHRIQIQNGKARLRSALPGINAAARRSGWVVLVDLDDSHACASALVADWLPTPSPYLRLRVAVRSVESWLLADAERFSEFLGVRRAAVPVNPESLAHPKDAVVALAAQSRRRAVREDMVPRERSGRRVGPAYTSRLIEFAESTEHGWRPEVAATYAPSLSRCIDRVRELVT